ncbi:MAG: hypothetical protein ABIR61_14305 [Casimicrobiaceae bacterium]
MRDANVADSECEIRQRRLKGRRSEKVPRFLQLKNAATNIHVEPREIQLAHP